MNQRYGPEERLLEQTEMLLSDGSAAAIVQLTLLNDDVVPHLVQRLQWMNDKKARIQEIRRQYEKWDYRPTDSDIDRLPADVPASTVHTLNSELEELMNATAANSKADRAAVVALGMRSTEAAIPLLAARLSPGGGEWKDAEIRSAANALRKIGTQPAAEALVAAVEHVDLSYARTTLSPLRHEARSALIRVIARAPPDTLRRISALTAEWAFEEAGPQLLARALEPREGRLTAIRALALFEATDVSPLWNLLQQTAQSLHAHRRTPRWGGYERWPLQMEQSLQAALLDLFAAREGPGLVRRLLPLALMEQEGEAWRHEEASCTACILQFGAAAVRYLEGEHVTGLSEAERQFANELAYRLRREVPRRPNPTPASIAAEFAEAPARKAPL